MVTDLTNGRALRGSRVVTLRRQRVNKRLKDAVAQLALGGRAETLVTVDALVQFTGSPRAASTVGEREVVKDEEVARPQGDPDFDVFDMEAMVLEERKFGVKAVELHPTKKIRVSFHARKEWRARGCGFNHARKAPFHVTTSVIPGAVSPPVGD